VCTSWACTSWACISRELSSLSPEDQKDENEGYFVLAEEADFELLKAHSEHLGAHPLDELLVDAEEN
jgi:hypothetical protein